MLLDACLDFQTLVELSSNHATDSGTLNRISYSIRNSISIRVAVKYKIMKVTVHITIYVNRGREGALYKYPKDP